MSAQAVIAAPRRGPWLAAARVWLRPLPLIGCGVAIAGSTTLAVLRHAIPPSPDEVSAAELSIGLGIAVLCWLAGPCVGFTWKRHVCRPQARLVPRWRAIHAACAAAMIATVAGVACAAALAAGVAPLAAIAIAALPTALGALTPFSLIAMASQIPIWIAIAAALVSRTSLRVAADALVGRRSDVVWIALWLGVVAIAALVVRQPTVDEDDVIYHLQLALGPPPSDAVRNSALARWIRRWDRGEHADERTAPLGPSIRAWAWHRRRLFLGVPWRIALAGDAAYMAIALCAPQREIAMYLALIATSTTPAAIFGRVLLPGFAESAPVEALRPASRRRDVASMVAAMLLVQARSLLLMAPCAAVVIALRDPHGLADFASATLAAALSAPAISVAALAIARPRRVPARPPALAGMSLFIGYLTIVCALEIVGRRSGWLCAIAALADLVVVPLLWRRLIRIDIE